MHKRDGPIYTIMFTAAVCAVCSVLVSAAAVGLRGRQAANEILEQRRQVLAATGLTIAEMRMPPDEINRIYEENITPRIINLKTGEYDDSIDPIMFDQREASGAPRRSEPAPPNNAGVTRLPHNAIVYHVMTDGEVDQLVLPVEGVGVWSRLYGYLAIDTDTTTVRGLTFYEHGETPGLGGEIESPRWQGLWPGRQLFTAEWAPAIRVIKGTAGPPEHDPHSVDGLSGATLTGRGVEHMINFWVGEHAYGPYLQRVRERGL